MATPATEVVFLPISTETTIEKPSSPAGQVWASTIETILAQEGAQRVYWGRQLETSNIVDFFVEWDSVERHKNFIASQGYKSFSKTLAGLLDGEESICHAYFTPHAPSAALARTPSPVIEFLIFYFPSTMSDLDRSSWN